MLHVCVLIISIWFYGVGHPPATIVEEAPGGPADCQASVAAAKAHFLAQDDVRDVQGHCLVVTLPGPRDKV